MGRQLGENMLEFLDAEAYLGELMCKFWDV